MPNIKEIVSRISSVNSTQQITKAMKMVAAAKLSKVQHQLLQLRPYTYNLAAFLQNILYNTENEVSQPYTEKRAVHRLMLVVISADKGLCGSFNANVIKKTETYLDQLTNLAPIQIDLLILGKKALTFFQKKNYNLITTYADLTSYTDLASSSLLERVKQATHFLIKSFLNHSYDRIELVYNAFSSADTQLVQIEPFLPLVSFSSAARDKEYTNYIYEPSSKELIETLLPMALQMQLYKALLESTVSEQGARMTTMSKATDNAETLLKSLRITYNKTRQAAITNEILEIAAGVEALTH